VSIALPLLSTIGLASTCSANLAKKASAGFAYLPQKMEITLAESSMITAGRSPSGKSSEAHRHDMHTPGGVYYPHYWVVKIIKGLNSVKVI
jgi:hypothetical protein